MRVTKPRDPLPSPSEFKADIRASIVDLMAVMRDYTRAYEYGLEPGRRGDGIPITGGDPSNVPLEMLENRRALYFQHLCRRVASRMRDVQNAAGNARSELREQVEAGAPQQPRDKSRAVVSAADFELALKRKADRDRRGVE